MWPKYCLNIPWQWHKKVAVNHIMSYVNFCCFETIDDSPVIHWIFSGELLLIHLGLTGPFIGYWQDIHRGFTGNFPSIGYSLDILRYIIADSSRMNRWFIGIHWWLSVGGSLDIVRWIIVYSSGIDRRFIGDFTGNFSLVHRFIGNDETG